MKLAELDFQFPESLVAMSPQYPPRVMWMENSIPQEVPFQQILELIPAGDLLVINETKVLKRRVFAGDVEILFLKVAEDDPMVWQVLFPSRKMKVGDTLPLPGGVVMTLLEKGRPQKVRTSRILTEQDFESFGELPLPPYIQKARGERHNRSQDESWYQTSWAEKPGSYAAPTASLHFKKEDLLRLSNRGVRILRVTLHVGLGTFLPVTTDDLNDHVMHSEWAEISRQTWLEVELAKKSGRHVWAMGTTVSRTLESMANGMLKLDNQDNYSGWTDLLIQPGYEWKVVDRLLTNFHQPQSTLLALVAAFSNLETVHFSYQWAMKNKFRLFSYGDLSVWMK